LVELVRLQMLHGTTSEFAASDPVLELAEIGIDTTLQKMKVGDGVSSWTTLPYFFGSNSIIFASRADMLAENIPAPVMKIAFLQDGAIFELARDTTGTAATTADGAKWSPAGDAMPQHWGAVADGATDDSAAFAGMFDWVLGDGDWRAVYIPAGHYVIESQYSTTADPHNDSAKYGLSVRGAGGGATVIFNKNRDGFFKWVQASANDIRAHFRDLEVRMANGGCNGTLFWLEQAGGGLSRQRDVVFERVNVSSEDLDADYAACYLRINGVYWPLISQCHFGNMIGPGVTTEMQQKGRFGLHLDQCSGFEVIDSKVWGNWYGLRMVEPNIQGAEGGLIKSCVIDSTTGVYVETAGTEPGMHITDTHFNCRDRNVKLVRKKAVMISDNPVWYMEEAARTNLFSNPFDLDLWLGGATITAAADADDLSWWLVEDTSGTQMHQINQDVAITAGTDYVMDAIVRFQDGGISQISGSFGQVRLTWGATADDVPTVSFLAAGQPYPANDYGVDDLGNGTWRLWATFNYSASITDTFYFWPDVEGDQAATGGNLVSSLQLAEGVLPEAPIEGTVTPTDLELVDCDSVTMSNTKFWFTANTRTNVKIDGDCTRLVFLHTDHAESKGTGFDIAAGADDIRIVYPIFGPDITSDIVDGGATNLRTVEYAP